MRAGLLVVLATLATAAQAAETGTIPVVTLPTATITSAAPVTSTSTGYLPVATNAPRGDLPLWEIGIGAALGGAPDYPGSDRMRPRALPLPYGIYRGKTLFEADESHASRFKFSPTVELDLSLGGALPADSSGGNAREGMPDLDLLIEVGPQLSILLAQLSRSSAVTLALPLRAVFSVNFDDVNNRGLLFAPELSYTNGKFASRGWSTRLTLGASTATERLTDYFYEVDPVYVRDDRPEYDARGGFLETSLTGVISRSFSNDIGLFAFTRLASLNGSANSDSPLLRDRSNLSFGLGIAYTFLRSERTVSNED